MNSLNHMDDQITDSIWILGKLKDFCKPKCTTLLAPTEFKILEQRDFILEAYFLQNRISFDSVDKLLPVSNMGYSSLKKC